MEARALRLRRWRRLAAFSTLSTPPADAHPPASSPTFEARFARLEYAGDDRFHLAFMRYTGEWIVIYRDIPLAAALAAIRDDPYFAI
jgi:hypothetical protein